MAKTKRPTGMTIARNGYKFTANWKVGDDNYGAGQQYEIVVEYGSPGGAYSSYTKTSKGTTNHKYVNYTIDSSTVCPTVGQPSVKSVTIKVRGKRSSYTKRKNGKNVTITPTWSEWTSVKYTVLQPKKPTVKATWDSANTNKTTFEWNVDTSNEHAVFAKVQYQTALATNATAPSYGAIATSTSASSSTTQTEDTSVINNGDSHTRYVRVRSIGMGGWSEYAEAKHVYADPKETTNMMVDTNERDGAVDVVANFNTSMPKTNPIDSIKIQYLITTPTAGLTVPAESSWTDGETILYKTGMDTARYTVDTTIADDKVLFVRANTIHDNNETVGVATIAKLGKLSTPTLSSVNKGNNEQVSVSATNNSVVPDSFLAVVYHDLVDADNSYIAGIIAHGQTSTTIHCPDWDDATKVNIGVYAVVGTATSDTRSDGSTAYKINPFEGGLMISDTVWTSPVLRPTTVTATQTKIAGTARVQWTWSQKDVSGAQISWADHDDAWESTDEPDTYDVTNLYSPAWNVSGLETGKTWYFRVRFFVEGEDAVQYGPWSEMVDLNLTSAPAIPTLVLAKDVIVQDEEIDASWVYISTDGTMQSYAEIREVTFTQGVIGYGDLLGSASTGQSITLDTEELGWSAGETHFMALRVVSESGRQSEWSEYVTIHVVEEVTCSISSTSLVSETVDDRAVQSLKAMPITVTITGAGNTKTTSLVIERAEPYFIERPDEKNNFDGYEGEAVYVCNQFGASAITVNTDDLIGRLDDGASYRLVATVSDAYGQKDTETLDFEVHWTHQALMPEGTVTVNQQTGIAVISPTAPSGAVETDTCDIYRLTADKPILIYPDAEFGTSYVDPYPTIGVYGGYRIVFKTVNGDYITANNTLAWLDLEGGLEVDGNIIDFDGDQVILTRNLDVSHSWDKDFTETRYLGGSVQGDWNPAVGRSASMSSATVTLIDEDEILTMRDLADYVGICNIRTRDGSNFKGDIQVSESRNHGNGGYVADFSLKITRVDSEGYDGITLAQWNNT